MMTTSASQTPRRGWYYGWNIVAVCILSQVATNGLPINAMSLFLQDWSTDLRAPISTLQLTLTGLGFASAALSPIIGALADKYPARNLFGVGLLGMALFCLCVSFVSQPWQLLTIYTILLPPSLCLAASLPANAVVSRWFMRRRGLALGLCSFGLGIAGAALPPIIAWLSPLFGWRLIWRFAALIIGLGILPVVLAVMRDRPTSRDGFDYVAAPEGRAHDNGAGSTNWRQIISQRQFWLLLCAYLPMLAVYGACLQNLAPIVAARGLSQESAGIMLSMFGMAFVSSALLMGILADHVGNRLLWAGLAFTTALGAVLLAFGVDFFAIASGVTLIGVSGGLWPLLATSAANEFGAPSAGRAFGLLALFVPITSLIPFAVAKAQESTGSYEPALVGLAALAVLGGLTSLTMRARRAADVVM